LGTFPRRAAILTGDMDEELFGNKVTTPHHTPTYTPTYTPPTALPTRRTVVVPYHTRDGPAHEVGQRPFSSRGCRRVKRDCGWMLGSS